MSLLPSTSLSSTLYLGFSTIPPATEDLVVFDSLETMFMGEPFVFDIIGSSHYIHSRTAGFHELCSCNAVDADSGADSKDRRDRTAENVHSLELNSEVTDEFEFNTTELASRTTASIQELSTFPSKRDFALEYVFAEDALTAIDIGESSYETFHTYPEYRCTVYTKTAFHRR